MSGESFRNKIKKICCKQCAKMQVTEVESLEPKMFLSRLLIMPMTEKLAVHFQRSTFPTRRKKGQQVQHVVTRDEKMAAAQTLLHMTVNVNGKMKIHVLSTHCLWSI